MGILHPGKCYLEKHISIQSEEDVLGYADFLLNEAGISGNLPVDLNVIFAHFQIPKPKYTSLPGQQGLLVDAERGLIVINDKDPEVRQRFTESHELTEMLFSVLPQGIELGAGWRLSRPGGFKESIKEYLCNRTAANLLMPPGLIKPYIQKYGVSFSCAEAVSIDFQVSLSAALVQLSQIAAGRYNVVLWRMKNKPTEMKKCPSSGQLSMFVDNAYSLPAQKLRVEWAYGTKDGPYIPKDKSTENSSLIYSAWESGSFTNGEEIMSFDGRQTGKYRTENLPFERDGERYVISLIEDLRK